MKRSNSIPRFLRFSDFRMFQNVECLISPPPVQSMCLRLWNYIPEQIEDNMNRDKKGTMERGSCP